MHENKQTKSHKCAPIKHPFTHSFIHTFSHQTPQFTLHHPSAASKEGRRGGLVQSAIQGGFEICHWSVERF